MFFIRLEGMTSGLETDFFRVVLLRNEDLGQVEWSSIHSAAHKVEISLNRDCSLNERGQIKKLLTKK